MAMPFTLPTRQYKGARGIDGVLVVTVTGDVGAQQRYAGTILTPIYRYSRAIAFQARLTDPTSGRNL
jgi:hypothetical protein